MATSGTISSTLNVRDTVCRALRMITVYGSNDTPSAEDAQEGMEQLNWMLKSWQSDGCNLWRAESVEIDIPADTSSVILDPRILDVQEARWLQTPGYEMPLQRWERGDYVTLPNKTQGGTPTVFYFERRRDDVVLTLWPVPTTLTTLYATVARVIEDVTDLNQTLDVPQEWNECVYYNLASRMLDMFGITETRPQLAQRITARAEALYQQMSGFDRPASIFFQPQAISR